MYALKPQKTITYIIIILYFSRTHARTHAHVDVHSDKTVKVCCRCHQRSPVWYCQLRVCITLCRWTMYTAVSSTSAPSMELQVPPAWSCTRKSMVRIGVKPSSCLLFLPLPLCPSVSQSLCLCLSLSLCLFVSVSLYQSLSLSVYLSVCLSSLIVSAMNAIKEQGLKYFLSLPLSLFVMVD